MGAAFFCEFYPVQDRSKDLLSKVVRDEIFRAAVEEAQYDYGHAGYTGTIAEKHKVLNAFEGAANVFSDMQKAHDAADQFSDHESDNRFADKWGPAGCICIDNPKQFGYLFLAGLLVKP